MTAEVLLLSVALASALVHIKAVGKKVPKAVFVRLLATDLEILTTGRLFSTKVSLPNKLK